MATVEGALEPFQMMLGPMVTLFHRVRLCLKYIVPPIPLLEFVLLLKFRPFHSSHKRESSGGSSNSIVRYA